MSVNYNVQSHLWGVLTAREYHIWVNHLNVDVTPLREALCEILQDYLNFIEEVGDDWDELFSDLMGWDIVLEDFYIQCVKDEFIPMDIGYNVNIDEWSYWQKYQKMETNGIENGVIKEIDNLHEEFEAKRNQDEHEPLVEMPKSVLSLKFSNKGTNISDESLLQLDELLSGVHAKAESDFETDIEAIKPSRQGLGTMFDDSTLAEIYKTRINIWGYCIVYVGQIELKFETYSGAKDCWVSYMLGLYNLD